MRLDIARLRGQIADDRAAAELQFTELAGLADLAESAGSRARAAIALHHGYSAIEAILERCTVALEGGVPKGPAYHQIGRASCRERV